MNLFAAAGVDLPPLAPGQAVRKAQRSLRVPLFAYKVVEEARARAAFAPTPEQIAAAADYARKAKRAFAKDKEEAVRPIFISAILEKLLGYTTLDPERPYTLAFEEFVGFGKVDMALGRFDKTSGRNQIAAPFEFKGPRTLDLDAPVSGRRFSPVEQAWTYAIDAPGAKWVLVSNCLELRLYAFGRGREAYEIFDLTRLDEPDEHARLWLLLAAERFLGGAADALLRDTDAAYKDVTDALYLEYKGLRARLIDFIVHSADGPHLAASAAIEPAQKILDRILFIAFAQRTDLLPERLLERAVKAVNEFDPQPVWRNFASLFRFVDKGSFDRGIQPYNGGLFTPDPAIDALMLPDALAAEIASLGEWDYRREVPVTVLGHIFEKSIDDIEKLKEGGAPPPLTKVKKQGVVYTRSDAVRRFIVERTIGLTLRERFDAAWANHGMDGAPDPAAQRAFWRDYQATLRGLTIVDPACGSGAFLVAAFDALALEYRRVEKALAALGETVDFDMFDEIVGKNLFGVDINVESVEITRLSLWLKTARRDHKLQNLDATIKVGDSLIEDGAFTARPFDWRAAFPQVFAHGGFDVVIGNPPYVRMELIKEFKPYLEKHYVVAADRADLYAYFFERGIGLLKPGGRLGFISSSTFFRTGSGEALRTFLTDNLAVESVVDFGDAQLFDGVTTYPAILTMRKANGEAGSLSFLVIDDDAPEELIRIFDETSRPMRRARLTAGSWRFEDEPLARLRDKLAAGRKTLGEIYGAPLRGIVTGLNDAFVIDTPTRDRLVAADPKSAELLKPFLRGEDVKRWRAEPAGMWLINTPKGKVDIDAYPAVRDWLTPFKPELEKRATKQEWWELQQAQLAYQIKLAEPKIVWSHFQLDSTYFLDKTHVFLNNKCFFLATNDVALCALINSQILWMFLFATARIKRGDYIEAEAQYVSQLPIPDMPDPARARLAALGEACMDAAARRRDIVFEGRRRILDLAPPERRKLNTKLEDWPALAFADFLKAVKTALRVDIPLKNRKEWQDYLAEQAAAVHALSADIARAEREIDAIVYRLFDLTPDEIALLEQSLAGKT